MKQKTIGGQIWQNRSNECKKKKVNNKHKETKKRNKKEKIIKNERCVERWKYLEYSEK